MMKWCAGCFGGDDYEAGIAEVEDTQALNTRTTKEKTYHLLVSFRPEDVDKLTPEALKDIEQRFATALGLADHQRHCGVHVNTEHMHLHVAYNLIHPERLVRVEPYRDYFKRDKLCRELEKEYGLTIDNGREKAPVREAHLSSSAATLEAHSGEQSFEGYAQNQGAVIVATLKEARSWEDVHLAFAEQGLKLAPRGAGLVVANRHGKQHCKASTVSRDLSLKKLEARFGAFAPASGELPESKCRYGKKPIHKEPNRSRLWEGFQELRAEQEADRAASLKKWQEYRAKINRQGIGQRMRTTLLRVARQRELEERHAIQMRYPANWIDYLQGMADRGNEEAVDVLRSRGEAMHSSPVERQKQQERAALLAEKSQILADTSTNYRQKKQLVSRALMRSIAPDCSMAVSKQGTVVFTLEDGSQVHDTGRNITYTGTARTVALAYMSAAWGVKRMERDREGKAVFVLGSGQRFKEDGACFVRPAPAPERQRARGWER